MTTLKQARDQGKLETFIKERDADASEPDGDAKAFNRTLASMTGTSKPTPGTSKRPRRDG